MHQRMIPHHSLKNFYLSLCQLLDGIKKLQIPLRTDDINGRVGIRQKDDVIGRFGDLDIAKSIIDF